MHRCRCPLHNPSWRLGDSDFYGLLNKIELRWRAVMVTVVVLAISLTDKSDTVHTGESFITVIENSVSTLFLLSSCYQDFGIACEA